jgi:hypothetical protein
LTNPFSDQNFRTKLNRCQMRVYKNEFLRCLWVVKSEKLNQLLKIKFCLWNPWFQARWLYICMYFFAEIKNNKIFSRKLLR